METYNKFKLYKLRFGCKRLTFRFLHLTVSEHLCSFEGGGSIEFVTNSVAYWPVGTIIHSAFNIFLIY